MKSGESKIVQLLPAKGWRAQIGDEMWPLVGWALRADGSIDGLVAPESGEDPTAAGDYSNFLGYRWPHK